MPIVFKPAAVALMLGVSALFLGGCGGNFATSYPGPGPSEARSDWKVARVNVVVPPTVTQSEQNSYVPKVDIVWHGDPLGDRRPQVAAIVKSGIEAGVRDLKGSESVVFNAALTRFHSLTPKAYYAAPSGTGVHSVAFTLTVNDARTGALIAGPVKFEADTPALMFSESAVDDQGMPSAEWKRVISSHVAATIRSWLGTGPDIRGNFSRLGG